MEIGLAEGLLKEGTWVEPEGQAKFLIQEGK